MIVKSDSYFKKKIYKFEWWWEIVRIWSIIHLLWLLKRNLKKVLAPNPVKILTIIQIGLFLWILL